MTWHALYISYDGVLDPIGASQVLAYVRRLAGDGLRWTVISFEKGAALANREHVAATRRELKQQGIAWVPLRYHKRPRLLATLWDMLRGLLSALRAHQRTPVHIVHGRSVVASTIGLVLQRCLRVKLLYDVRGLWSDELLINGRLRGGFVYRLVKRLERALVKDADHVVVLTNAVKERWRQLGLRPAHDISVIPCCVEPRFQFSHEARQRMRERHGLTDRFVVLFAGSLEHWYRAEQMIDCFIVYKQWIPAAHLLMLVSGGAHVLQRLQARPQLSERDITVTHVPYASMPAYLSAADLGLFFLQTPPAAVSVSPVKLAEYISCYLPVLSNTGIGDMDALFAQYRIGALVDECTPDAYAASVRQIQALRAQPDAFRQACDRAIEEQLGVAVGAQRYRRIYAQWTSSAPQRTTAQPPAVERLVTHDAVH